MTFPASNFHFDITHNGDFELILPIAFLDHAKVTHWEDRQLLLGEKHGARRALIFYWTDPSQEGAYPLPVPLDAESSKELIIGWLKGLPKEALGPEDDFDGSSGRGYRICTRHPNVPIRYQASFIVLPEWMEYHK